jgi:hypothetical protein
LARASAADLHDNISAGGKENDENRPEMNQWQSTLQQEKINRISVRTKALPFSKY